MKKLLIGLIKDESAKYDGYNWHDEYAKHFVDLGDDVEFFNPKSSDCQEKISKSKSDAFLWRAWHRPDDRDDAKNKIYFIDKILNKRIFPDWNMYWSYDNKAAQLTLMEKLGIPHPKTFFSRDKDEIKKFVENASYPLISKCSEGACGDNVRKIDSKNELEEHVDQILSDNGLQTYFPWIRQKGYVYLQEYMPLERDMRIIVLGDKSVYSCWFESKNWKKFGSDVNINFNDIPKKAETLCEDVAKKIGFHWAAFDVAQYNNKYYIFEFSSVFGFSFKEPLMKKFGSPNANVLQKQAEYIHNYLGRKNEK